MKILFNVSLLIIVGLLITTNCKKSDDDSTDSITDVNGSVYKTIKIGNQIWMAENLKVTKYRDGTLIPNIKDNSSWHNLTIGAYCNYNNDSIIGIQRGRLYNWYAVTSSHNLAPEGWHIPSDSEWQILINYLGGIDIAGGKMKETGTSHWKTPNTGANNESGFNAIPCGSRGPSFFYADYGYDCAWWSTTEYSSETVWWWQIEYSDIKVYRRNDESKRNGMTIRCIKD